MATKDATNTKTLLSFSKLKPIEQRAIELKSTGKPYEQILVLLAQEFGEDGKMPISRLEQWFYVNGRLYQAYQEYIDILAQESLKIARKTVMRGQEAAAGVLVEQLANTKDERIRNVAARALLNKYLPDRQVVLGGTAGDEEIPDELSREADALLTGKGGDDGADAGPEPVDNADQGQQPDSAEAGPGNDQEVPQSVLPEPEATDGPGNPPA